MCELTICCIGIVIKSVNRDSHLKTVLKSTKQQKFAQASSALTCQWQSNACDAMAEPPMKYFAR